MPTDPVTLGSCRGRQILLLLGRRPAPPEPGPGRRRLHAHILPGLLLVAFGPGPVFVGVTTAANAGVGPGSAGLAAAIPNSSQQIGGALGLAIFSAVGAAGIDHFLPTGTPPLTP